MRPYVPQPRGPLSEMLGCYLRRHPCTLPRVLVPDGNPLTDEDLQLSLHLCYGLHYDGFAGVDDGWEWEPSLLGLRAELEARFLDIFKGWNLHGRSVEPISDGKDLVNMVKALISGATGPSLSTFVLEEGNRDHLREFVIHRSVYQRKEADPHTWVIPRLRGRAKSACVLLQCNEYGDGTPGRSHAELFADTMRAFDLDPTPGSYVDVVPAATLATDNLVSFLGLHRKWRGALVGHLAAFEMTSVIPMSRYAAAVRRHLPEAAAEFYAVHVEADAVHEQIAADELLTGLVETDPQAARDVPFGVGALLTVEQRFADHLLSAWQAGRMSLRTATDRWAGTWEPPADSTNNCHILRAPWPSILQTIDQN